MIQDKVATLMGATLGIEEVEFLGTRSIQHANIVGLGVLEGRLFVLDRRVYYTLLDATPAGCRSQQ